MIFTKLISFFVNEKVNNSTLIILDTEASH